MKQWNDTGANQAMIANEQGAQSIGRREFLGGAAAATALIGGGVAAGVGSLASPAIAQQPAQFPDGFLWGTSTSSYQIEGAATADGRGPSIWDTLSHTPGKVLNNDTGDVAADHYNRYLEDVALMADAGLKAYRFSIAWPRIQPTGSGPANAKGLDFYDRLVDALLRRGIEPWPCLYHWDLPQALQDRGGWTNRDIADWFADYALIVAGRLGDRAKNWVMLNEPSVVAIFGHGVGGHAPDLRGRENFCAAIHHQNLAQGRALSALRAVGAKDWKLGTVLSVQPVKPSPGNDANRHAAAQWDAVWNRSCLDPLFKGQYPDSLIADFKPLIKQGDMEAIRQPIDFLGLNYYSRMHQVTDPGGLFGTNFGPSPEGTKYTDMGWPVEPEGLYEQLIDFRDNYGNIPVYVTENGASYGDWVGPTGKAEDGGRIFYIRDHLLACHRAIKDGANLKGYFVWTLLDNFEWGFGYTQHFGLVQVDRETMQRRPKASYYWYGDVAKSNEVPL
ncbi:beta-glucosidase [Skermanella aerolata]|uniref:Beta-glucosidase n=2 Tax=Skermanella aerolata TaxID=393310 RepID=A0A512E0I1_9PROT|nr:beta-glucosidase [Skermanella aerolata]